MSAIKGLGGLDEIFRKYGKDGIVKILFDAFPKLTKVISSTTAAATAAGGGFAGLKAGAIALAGSLTFLQKAFIALAAAAIVVKVVDALTVSLDESKEKLANLKSEYNNNKNELISLNNQLETTGNRIRELEAMGTLSFVDQSELNNLKEQNAELERQILLLGILQKKENEELNRSFIDTMKKDVEDSYEFTAGMRNASKNYAPQNHISKFSGAVGLAYTQIDERDYINAVLLRREEILDEISDDGISEKEKKKLDKQVQEIDEYLLKRQQDFAEISSGISRIENPTEDYEKEVNNYLDMIDDFNDRIGILWADPAKKSKMQAHAFTRLINGQFSEVTKGLQDLGKQGKVTAEMLGGEAYDDFIQKLIYLGVISDDSENSLGLVALAFNNLDSAVNSTVESTENGLRSISKASEGTLNKINEISSAQKLLNSQESGKSVSLSDLTAEGMEDYASALEYVNGVYQLNAEKVNAIIEAKAKEQIVTNETNKAYVQSEYLKNAKQIHNLREEIKNYTGTSDDFIKTRKEMIHSLLEENSVLQDECAQYDLMCAALTEATGAYQAWLDAQNAPQAGEMFDGALSAVKQIDDVLNNSDSELFGRVGRTDYKKSVDFIVPDSVDHEDAAAVNAYLESIDDMFTFDDNGNRTGLNIDNFIQKATDEGLIAINEAGDAYRIAAHKTMEDFATELGLSLPLVRAMFGELEEFGAKFDWADEASKTVGDLGVAAYESAEALRSVDQFKDLKIVMDVSDFDDVNKACDTLDSTIDQMQDFKLNLNPDIDQDKLQQADDIIRYCVAQKQLLSAPAIMSVDVSRLNSDIAPAFDLLQQFQNAQNELEMNTEVGIDTSAAEAKIDGLVSQIQGLDTEVFAKLNIDTTDKESIRASIRNLDAPAIVNFGVDSTLVEAFENADHSAQGVVNWYDNTENLSKSFSCIGYVHRKDASSPSKSTSGGGGNFVNGTSNASGSAKIGGDWRAKGGRSLVGELGREIIVDPNTGRWYTVGDNGAEFVDIPEGAIIFNHLQSDALLNNGRVSGRGSAKANGSAYVGGLIPIISGIIGGVSKNKPKKASPAGKSPSSPNAANKTEDSKEVVDWIEIVLDRIGRAIERLSNIAQSAFKSLGSRMKASRDEISSVNKEIELQQRAYDRYIQEANSVDLSSDLKELVRNGAIDISRYDDDTKKKIDEYQEWYEKALDCSDAMDTLHESIAQIYKNNFDAIQDDYSNKLSMMEKASDEYERKLDMLEEKGHMLNANYYVEMQNIGRQNIQLLNQELNDLKQAFDKGIRSGEIEEGSEAWYEMMLSIEDTKAAIDDAELSIIEYGNAIRDIEWGLFDTAQNRISQINSEADFLLSLLDGKDVFDDKGNLSDAGAASIGLRAEKYGVYMAQADKYAVEMKRINRELASDPNNKTLLERRDELLDAQRESIQMAKQEKEAAVDLAKEGIQVELDAVKDLIDAYTESLDSAKDLYDYQKKIAEKTDNISSLEKQLAAYQNDMSEETKAKVQKIQVDLKEARDDLKDTEYDRFVSESKKALDTLYSDYEETLNRRFDDIDAAFARLIDMVNENFIDINEYLSKESGSVGYEITEATKSIWESGGIANGVVSEYGADISSKLSSVGTTVESIFSTLDSIARENGVSLTGVKSYSSGGLIDYTGIANVHGSLSDPELVLNSDDTKNFLMLRNALRNMADGTLLAHATSIKPVPTPRSIAPPEVLRSRTGESGYSVGEINVTIPIEHVSDYNDFVNQIRNDRQFEQMIQDWTIGRIARKNSLTVKKYQW